MNGPPDSWMEIARTAYYERRPGLSITKVAALLSTHCDAAFRRGLSAGGWAAKGNDNDVRECLREAIVTLESMYDPDEDDPMPEVIKRWRSALAAVEGTEKPSQEDSK
jgi:hypothetical protein